MKTIKSQINKILNEFNYEKYTAADIDGKRVMLKQVEVRALQVMCKRASDSGHYDEFVNRVVVYTDADAKKINRFRKDGKFADCFDDGFYGIESNMAFEIL